MFDEGTNPAAVVPYFLKSPQVFLPSLSHSFHCFCCLRTEFYHYFSFFLLSFLSSRTHPPYAAIFQTIYICGLLEAGRGEVMLSSSYSQWEEKLSHTIDSLLYPLTLLAFFIPSKLPWKLFEVALTSTHSLYSHLLLSTE